MMILIKRILFESTSGTASRPPGFDWKNICFEKPFWFKRTFLIERCVGKVFLAGPDWPAGGRPAGANSNPHLEPNPYKTCRLLRIFGQKGVPKTARTMCSSEPGSGPEVDSKKTVWIKKSILNQKKCFECKTLFWLKKFFLENLRFDWWKNFLIEKVL